MSTLITRAAALAMAAVLLTACATSGAATGSALASGGVTAKLPRVKAGDVVYVLSQLTNPGDFTVTVVDAKPAAADDGLTFDRAVVLANPWTTYVAWSGTPDQELATPDWRGTTPLAGRDVLPRATLYVALRFSVGRDPAPSLTSSDLVVTYRVGSQTQRQTFQQRLVAYAGAADA